MLISPWASVCGDVAMLENMSRRNRSLLSLSLTSLALTLSVSAFCTSYWCEGTHKVVKPLCLSPVKMKNCGQNNSQPYTTGEGRGFPTTKSFPQRLCFQHGCSWGLHTILNKSTNTDKAHNLDGRRAQIMKKVETKPIKTL